MSAVETQPRPKGLLPIPAWLRPGASPPGTDATAVPKAPATEATADANVRTLGDWAAMAVWVLTALSVLAVWCLVYAAGFSAFEEHAAQGRLHDHFRSALAGQTLPVGGAIKTGTPVALINAPIAGARSLVVVEGTSAHELRNGPGHLRGSVLPGQVGWSQVYGRGALFGAPFRDIKTLATGAVLTVTDELGTFHYTVDRIREPGDQIPALAAGAARLTLVSATGSGWAGGWMPSHLVYVDATLTDKALPVTDPPTVGPAKDELAMHADRTALIPLVLWLQLLAVAAIGFAWARVRWGHRETLLVGIPVLVAAAWGATGAATQLLPNLF